MKDTVKIFIIALPFSWFASISLPFLHQLGLGVWLVETLSIRGYWPVSVAFYVEDLLSAAITALPFIGLVFFLTAKNKPTTTTATLFAYMFFTFLLCFQKESLTACLFTLVQSANIAVYAAIILLFSLLKIKFGQGEPIQ